MKGFLTPLLSLLLLSAAWANPNNPKIEPAAFITRADEYTSSSVAKANRIYLFGPVRSLTPLPSTNIRIYSAMETKKVADLWSNFIFHGGRGWTLAIYRNGKWLPEKNPDPVRSQTPLEPGDAVFIFLPQPAPAENNSP